MNNKIINDDNYDKYIHYIESNLIGLPVMTIFKYRLFSSIRSFLYIEQRGNLKTEEKGVIYNKRSNTENAYILTKMENSNYQSLYLNGVNQKIEINFSNQCVIRHKLFKNFYLIYPYLENDKKTLKFISKEGKINLFITIIIIIITLLGFLSLSNLI